MRGGTGIMKERALALLTELNESYEGRKNVSKKEIEAFLLGKGIKREDKMFEYFLNCVACYE
jgi:hypothetical protein